MALRLLYKNEVTFIESNSSTENNDAYLTDERRTKKWTDVSTATTVFTGRFGDNPSSPGDQRLIKALGFVHNLPLNCTIRIQLYDGTVSGSNSVYNMAEEPLAPSVSHEGIFHPAQLDSNGHLIDPQRQDFTYVHHIEPGVVATDFEITLDYLSSINPIIRYIYVGDSWSIGYDVAREYVPVIKDESQIFKTMEGNRRAKLKKRFYGMDLFWPAITGAERHQLTNAALHSGISHTVIADLYSDENNYRSTVDRVWGMFEEPVAFQRRRSVEELFTASGLIMEH